MSKLKIYRKTMLPVVVGVTAGVLTPPLLQKYLPSQYQTIPQLPPPFSQSYFTGSIALGAISLAGVFVSTRESVQTLLFAYGVSAISSVVFPYLINNVLQQRLPQMNISPVRAVSMRNNGSGKVIHGRSQGNGHYEGTSRFSTHFVPAPLAYLAEQTGVTIVS